ncbi:hypothetical protein ACG2LH_00785 [Zhouia sp. PK063]|uniref:hypothetical protein n=1 Tax=Zhouia sp. PK063 TaxID=3373602 RepID=UPI003793899D
MAKQSGIIKLEGLLGDISFYKTSEGFKVREKGGVSAKRIANDPAFQRTRENNAEFGQAGKSSKILRNALQLVVQKAKDKYMTSRLTTAMLAVVKTDTQHTRGQRMAANGNLQLLRNFEFNSNGKLDAALLVLYALEVNRTAGEVQLALEEYQPNSLIVPPAGTTHYQISLALAEVDLTAGTFVFAMKQTEVLPYNATNVAAETLTAAITPETTLPVFVVLGVEFFQEVNGAMYSLKNGSYNALKLIAVDEVS